MCEIQVLSLVLFFNQPFIGMEVAEFYTIPDAFLVVNLSFKLVILLRSLVVLLTSYIVD